MFSILPIKGTISDIDGFYSDGLNIGLKLDNNPDIGFIYSDTLCNIETIFTQNRFQAAPLKHYQKYAKDFKTNFILVNSKNANAMTGKKGLQDIEDIFKNIEAMHKSIINPVMSSTGVIGVPIDKEKIINGVGKFNLKNKNGTNFSKAIMTTDSFNKSCLYEIKLENGEIFKIGAVAKGAGMINPNLATMLCFVCTDASVPKKDMKELLLKNTETTFNAISVDGDMSTNDSLFLLSNQKSKAYDKSAFAEALRIVMEDMAMLIVSDGEGAKKTVAFHINGAKNNSEAQIVSKALSNSLLVKTALFGEDPNWGRIASTIGASGVSCDEEKLTIIFDNIIVYQKGILYFDKVTESKAAEILKNKHINIRCDLGLGDGHFTAYGCDLGYDYIKINADYRT